MVFRRKWVWTWTLEILRTSEPLSLFFFSSSFFQEQMSLEILNLSLKNSPNSTLEFEDFEKNMSLEILHLSLENSPNSVFFNEILENFPNAFLEKNPIIFPFDSEFGEFSKLRKKWIWVWRILQTHIQKNFFLSLENSPNSRVEFGEFSKLKGWVWRFLQTQVQNLKLRGWEKIQNSEVEFGEFSRLRGWVWRILQTQVLSLENSPNSDSKERFLWLWRNLQTQGLSLENSPNSGSKSPNSFVSQKKSKLRGWVWRILQTQWLRILQTQAFFKSTRNPKP